MFFAPVIRRSAYAPALRSFDRSFERFLNDSVSARDGLHASASQDDQHTTLTLDVPGLAREHLTVQIEENVVRIASVEGAPRSVKASYALAQEIDPATSEAKVEHGVLTLKLGKLQPVSKATTLTVG